MRARHTVQRHTLAAAVALTVAVTLAAGCDTDGAASDAACGGHGELHGDHCHCDPGYAPADQGLACVEDPDGDHDGHDDHDDDGHDDHDDDGHDDHDDDGHDDHDDDGHDPTEEALSFEPAELRAVTGLADDGARVWLLEATDGDATLRLELYASFGGPTAPGVVEISEAETSYATCGTCLILQTGCVAHGDHAHCDRTFMPRAGGSLRLDAIDASADGHLAGEVVDVTFHEVTIHEDYRTEAVVDGAHLRLDAWSFDATLEAFGDGEAVCSGHGHRHGDHCHCDDGYQVDPDDPTRCVPAS